MFVKKSMRLRLTLVFGFFLLLAVSSSFPVGSAQEGIDDCARTPLRGATTAVLTRDIANSGVFYFDPASVPNNPVKKVYLAPVTKRACAQKVEGSRNVQLKGWAWNDNFGWTSFYCPGPGGNNLGAYCGDQKYGVTIAEDGKFSGYAWSNAGWIRFSCSPTAQFGDSSHCSASQYGVTLDVKKIDQDKYVPLRDPSFALSSSVGWLNFVGMKVPFEAKPLVLKDEDGDGVVTDNDVALANPDNPLADNGGTGGVAGGGNSGGGNSGGGFGGDSGSSEVGACSPDNDKDGFCANSQPPAKDCNDNQFLASPAYPEICADGIDNDCDGQTDVAPYCQEEDGGVKPVADVTAEHTFNTPYTIGNLSSGSDGTISVGSSLRADARNLIFKNVQQLKRSASTQCGSLGNILFFQPQDDVYYCRGDVTIGPVAPWTGRKTLIVEDGNVFIRGDIFPDDFNAQLGLIVLRTNLKDTTKANVYVAPAVHNLRLQLFADGSLFPGVADANGKVKKLGSAAVPNISDADYGTSGALFGQLFMQGLFVTHNNAGLQTYFENTDKHPDAFGKKTISDPNVGKLYSFSFLRAVPKKTDTACKGKNPTVFPGGRNLCVQSWDKFTDVDSSKLSSKLKAQDSTLANSTYGVVIFYEPPADDLPGFTNLGAASAVQR